MSSGEETIYFYAYCADEWWNFGEQSGRVVLSGVAVFATMRPPTFQPNRLVLSWFMLEGAAWGRRRAELTLCLLQ